MNQQHLFPFQNLDAYRVARELARRVHESKIRDRELRDQATRAAKSCFLCLCEGLPNEGAAMRHKYFVEARNSLAETVGAMDLAAIIGVARQEDVDTHPRARLSAPQDAHRTLAVSPSGHRGSLPRWPLPG